MHTIDFREQNVHSLSLRDRLPRPHHDVAAAEQAAQQLIADVRENGRAALIDQAQRFDHVQIDEFRVSQAEIDAAVRELDPSIRHSLEIAIERVRKATAAQLREPVVTTFPGGSRITQRWAPVQAAGLYVPGGKAVYPSSVIMNVVPAQVAGVQRLALVSPAQQAFGGAVHPLTLATAGLLGLDEIYALGGAGAIAALAYGVPEIGLDAVDVISGPGNAFVAAAKLAVSRDVAIDSVAGPTEILVIADEHADADLVAADLLSQAEHDEDASSVLVTDSETFADQVRARLSVRLDHTPNRERASVALNGEQSAVVLVDDLDAALAVSDAYAPEHLEIITESAEELADRVRNAGAIFVGPYSPVPLGDYMAGSNHVLPTSGRARFSPALGAYTFLRPQQIIEYTREGLAEIAEPIERFAEAEKLNAHAESIAARFESKA
ncbi:histidinol dehydrogenase [Pseudoclavibacter sp. CFCC 11306]|uniref:histidinol dehydrogenase n=1 Tax=Pseudoclavibacter sp. CFCC 11306 TaxID=1564493 RepID=UPI001300FAD7|nr:histidinol dehydrogenase [Pseudoclavibacter sp. CFCC 11306]KAB1658204.1 histidinol dehydrogenase [Pseudoclavibacter sp. CFCC 11306]